MTQIVWFLAGVVACLGGWQLARRFREKRALTDTLKQFFGKV